VIRLKNTSEYVSEMSGIMSLDKAKSSDPNLKAAHAEASTKKTRHLQPNASHAPAAEGVFSWSNCKSGKKPGPVRQTIS
jgi:hypothetical protein